MPALARYLTPTRVSAFHRCKLAFKLSWVDHADPGPPPFPLVAGSYLHACLAAHHRTEPRDASAVVALVAEVREELADRLPDAELCAAQGVVATALLDYHRWPERARGDEVHAELDLRGSLGAVTFAARADLVTYRTDTDTVTADEFKLSMPADDGLLQASAAHLGLRCSLYPGSTPIVHRVVWFRRDGHPEIGARTVALDADAYRRTLLGVYETARSVGREFARPADEAWAPSPGAGCAVCDHAGGACPHAAALVVAAARDTF